MITIKEVQERVNNRFGVGTINLLDYKGTAKKCKVECGVCGDIREIFPTSLYSMKNPCNKCYQDLKKFNTEQKYLEVIKEKGITLESEYTGAKDLATFKHTVCGHVWQTTANNILYNSCPKCARKTMGPSRLTTESIEDWITKDGSYELVKPIENYGNNRDTVEVRCLVCKTIKITTVNNLKAEKGCPCCVGSVSKEEMELRDLLPPAIYNTKDIIPPKELDIYFPINKVAVEYCGTYWHSATKKDKLYHYNKFKQCEDLGIKLIQVWDHEFRNKKEIVLSRIKTSLGLSTKVYARDCKVVELDVQLARDFLDKNHIQGYSASGIRLGLKYYGELVAVMTFGNPRFSNSHDWELIRFSSLLDVKVTGGASKLLKYFRTNNKGSIISYCDLRYGSGGMYSKLGFSLYSTSAPNYFYVKGTDVVSRYQGQKHKLHNLLEEFDGSFTERENMEYNGYYLVYDAGNRVYTIN